MKKGTKTLVNFAEKHKKELMTATSIGIAVVAFIIIKNKIYENVEDAKKPFEELVKKPIKDISIVEPILVIPTNNNVAIGRKPHDVSGYIRNLPEGYKASEEKILTAAKNGYKLGPGQTWVVPYKTGRSVA